MPQDTRKDQLYNLYLTEALDDVDCSPSTLFDRSERINRLEMVLGESVAATAFERAQAHLDTVSHYCSGAPYQPAPPEDFPADSLPLDDDTQVMEGFECPQCGEDQYDNLTPDEDEISCTKCGTVYNAFTKEVIRQDPQMIAMLADRDKAVLEEMWVQEQQLIADLRSPSS